MSGVEYILGVGSFIVEFLILLFVSAAGVRRGGCE